MLHLQPQTFPGWLLLLLALGLIVSSFPEGVGSSTNNTAVPPSISPRQQQAVPNFAVPAAAAAAVPANNVVPAVINAPPGALFYVANNHQAVPLRQVVHVQPAGAQGFANDSVPAGLRYIAAYVPTNSNQQIVAAGGGGAQQMTEKLSSGNHHQEVAVPILAPVTAQAAITGVAPAGSTKGLETTASPVAQQQQLSSSRKTSPAATTSPQPSREQQATSQAGVPATVFQQGAVAGSSGAKPSSGAAPASAAAHHQEPADEHKTHQSGTSPASAISTLGGETSSAATAAASNLHDSPAVANPSSVVQAAPVVTLQPSNVRVGQQSAMSSSHSAVTSASTAQPETAATAAASSPLQYSSESKPESEAPPPPAKPPSTPQRYQPAPTAAPPSPTRRRHQEFDTPNAKMKYRQQVDSEQQEFDPPSMKDSPPQDSAEMMRPLYTNKARFNRRYKGTNSEPLFPKRRWPAQHQHQQRKRPQRGQGCADDDEDDDDGACCMPLTEEEEEEEEEVDLCLPLCSKCPTTPTTTQATTTCGVCAPAGPVPPAGPPLADVQANAAHRQQKAGRADMLDDLLDGGETLLDQLSELRNDMRSLRQHHALLRGNEYYGRPHAGMWRRYPPARIPVHVAGSGEYNPNYNHYGVPVNPSLAAAPGLDAGQPGSLYSSSGSDELLQPPAPPGVAAPPMNSAAAAEAAHKHKSSVVERSLRHAGADGQNKRQQQQVGKQTQEQQPNSSTTSRVPPQRENPEDQARRWRNQHQKQVKIIAAMKSMAAAEVSSPAHGQASKAPQRSTAPPYHLRFQDV